GSGVDSSYGMTVDDQGNVYTTGAFASTVDFDPGPESFTLTSGRIDIFISKLDAAGGFVWARQMKSQVGGYGVGISIAVDESSNVYTTGLYAGITDFDPGDKSFYLVSDNQLFNDNIFVSKLDSSGNFA